MKKIELHCHLDGSLNVKHASELLGHVSPEEAAGMMTAHGSSSLADYLEKFQVPLQLLQTQHNLTEFSRLLAQDLTDDGVIYAEIRFCPLLHCNRRLSARKAVEAVLEGLRKIPSIQTNIILCMMRQFSLKDNQKIIELASEFRNDGVCGVDLAGDEAAHPNSEFMMLFHWAHQVCQLPLTVHAGEADTFTGVDAALHAGATRIGHGVRAIESATTIQSLVHSHIPLEICLSSNIDTGVYPSLGEHPIRKLLDAGVTVTINTDNRTVSGTTLEKEYQLLREVHGFTDEEFLRFNLNAALGSFANPDLKVKLCQELLADYSAN